MKVRFFCSIIVLLCLFFASLQNAFAEEGATTTKLSTTNSPSVASRLVGSSVPKTSDFAQSATKGIVYCLALLLLAYGLKRKFRSKTTNDQQNPITLIARKSLGQRCSLVLVEVNGKRLLLSHSLDCLSLITELDELNYLETKAEPFEKSLNLAVNE